MKMFSWVMCPHCDLVQLNDTTRQVVQEIGITQDCVRCEHQFYVDGWEVSDPTTDEMDFFFDKGWK